MTSLLVSSRIKFQPHKCSVLLPRTTGRWTTPRDAGAPCQVGSRKSLTQSQRTGLLTQELWEFLALGPSTREQIHSFPGPCTTIGFMEAGGRDVLGVPGQFSPCEHAGSETEQSCTWCIHSATERPQSMPRAEPSRFLVEIQFPQRAIDICLED